MKAFIFLSIVAVAFASRQCGENQHYDSCGTACPLTCDNYLNPPNACILMCNPGCHCDEGYVKTNDGRCIRPVQCPVNADQQCGENQHFESCGTACPLTCDNYDNPPKFCILRCDIGCHCDAGYVKTNDGRCVKPEECPAKTEQVCGENERYYGCGTACPLTCDNYANPPKICPLMCIIGCQCEKGYVKTKDGRCVRPEDCPADAQTAEKTCLGKPDPGLCKAYMPSWYYDVKQEKCFQFIYGGCQGNGNRYATEEECMNHCKDVKLRQSTPEACDLPAETGVCRGYFPRYFFDRPTGECREFIYGGCGGNDNNFESQEDCEHTCKPVQAASAICSLPAVTGPCKAYFERFHFDIVTGTCKKFVYGGCGGNKNNFKTIEDCQAKCA